MLPSTFKKTSKMSALAKVFPQIILWLIVLIALGFRLYQIDKSVWLQNGYDESRDMLVADHIVNNNEYPTRGPLASGGMEWLNNSPIYYYFVALIWLFIPNPLFFMYFWTILMTTPVLFGYFIGKKAQDKTTGLILASLLAINSQMISSSRELLQPHLLLLFSTAFIWASISYLKEKKYHLKYLLLIIFFLLAPLHFHYGALLILPLGFIFTIYCWLHLNIKTKKVLFKTTFSSILLI